MLFYNLHALDESVSNTIFARTFLSVLFSQLSLRFFVAIIHWYIWLIQFNTCTVDIVVQSLPSTEMANITQLVVGHTDFFSFVCLFVCFFDCYQCVFLSNSFIVTVACRFLGMVIQSVFGGFYNIYWLNKYNFITQCCLDCFLCFVSCLQGFGCWCVLHSVMIK